MIFRYLTDWAVGFQHRQDGLERVAMNPRNALDFLDPMPGVLVERFAGRIPVPSDQLDIVLGDQARYRPQAFGQCRRLPDPAGIGSNQAQNHAEHIDFPFGIEAAPALAPLEVPIPYSRKHQHGEAEAVERHAAALYGASWIRRQRTEHEAEVLDLLRCAFLVPDPVALQAECRQRRRLEPQ